MAPEPCTSCDAPQREVNPLLVLLFCPHCVLSGIFAAAATGVVTIPPLMGVPAEHYLAPVVLLGMFVGWIAWGQWHKRAPRRSTPRKPVGGERCTATPLEG